MAASSLREAKEYTESMEMLWEACSDTVEYSKSLFHPSNSNANLLDCSPAEIICSDNTSICGNSVSVLLSYIHSFPVKLKHEQKLLKFFYLEKKTYEINYFIKV